MRFLGVDFGEKRIGLAISDERGRIATPLGTIERRSDTGAIAAIETIIAEEGVEALVVGEPRRADGRRGDAAERVTRFARKLQARTGLRLLLTDELLTSHAAERRLRRSKGAPDRVDAVAAQILLQQALDDPSATSSLPPPPERSAGSR